MGPVISVAGKTPLHWAALNGRTNVIRLLLKYKAEVKAVNVMSQTALDLTSGQQRSLAGFFMMRHGMVDLVEPLQIQQSTRQVSPFMQSEQQRQGPL